jgi:hypothetical protein
MDVKKPITVELAKQMLAVRGPLDHLGLVQLRRRLRKTTLRTADRDHPPAEGLREVESKPVQRVPFRQGSLLSPSTARLWSRNTSIAIMHAAGESVLACEP